MNEEEKKVFEANLWKLLVAVTRKHDKTASIDILADNGDAIISTLGGKVVDRIASPLELIEKYEEHM